MRAVRFIAERQSGHGSFPKHRLDRSRLGTRHVAHRGLRQWGSRRHCSQVWPQASAGFWTQRVDQRFLGVFPGTTGFPESYPNQTAVSAGYLARQASLRLRFATIPRSGPQRL